MKLLRTLCWVVVALVIVGGTVGLLLAADTPKEDAAKKEIKAFYNWTEDRGMWSVVSAEAGGKREKDMEALILGFEGGTISTNVASKTAKQGEDAEVTFKLDPSKTPKAIDLTPKGDVLFHKFHTPKRGMTFKGIYSLEKGNITICLAPPTEDRPADFDSKPNRIKIVLKPYLLLKKSP